MWFGVCWIYFISVVSADFLVRQANLNFTESNKNIILIYPSQSSSPLHELDLALPLHTDPLPLNASRVMFFNALQPPQPVDIGYDETMLSLNSEYAKPIVFPMSGTNVHIPVNYIAFKAGTKQEIARLTLDLKTDFPNAAKVTITLVGTVGSNKYPPMLLRHVIQRPVGLVGEYATFCNLVPIDYNVFVSTKNENSLPFQYQTCETIAVDSSADKSILDVWRQSDDYIDQTEAYAPGNLTLLIVHRAGESRQRWFLSESSVIGHQDHIILANTVLSLNVSWNSKQDIVNNVTKTWDVSLKVENPAETPGAIFGSLNVSTSSSAHFQLVCFVGNGTNASPYRLVNVDLPFVHAGPDAKSATLCNFVEGVVFRGMTQNVSTKDLSFTECSPTMGLSLNQSRFVVSRRDVIVDKPNIVPPNPSPYLNFVRNVQQMNFKPEGYRNVYAIWKTADGPLQMNHLNLENNSMTEGKNLFLMNSIGKEITWSIRHRVANDRDRSTGMDSRLTDHDVCGDPDKVWSSPSEHAPPFWMTLALPIVRTDVLFKFGALEGNNTLNTLACATRGPPKNLNFNSIVALVGKETGGRFPYTMTQFNISRPQLPPPSGTNTWAVVCNTIPHEQRLSMSIFYENGDTVQDIAMIGYKECAKIYVSSSTEYDATFVFYNTSSTAPCPRQIRDLTSQKDAVSDNVGKIKQLNKEIDRLQNMETCSGDRNSCCELGVTIPPLSTSSTGSDYSQLPSSYTPSGSAATASNVMIHLKNVGLILAVLLLSS